MLQPPLGLGRGGGGSWDEHVAGLSTVRKISSSSRSPICSRDALPDGSGHNHLGKYTRGAGFSKVFLEDQCASVPRRSAGDVSFIPQAPLIGNIKAGFVNWRREADVG